MLNIVGFKPYFLDKWQVKRSTATVASLGSTTAVPSSAHSTPCPQQLADLAPQTPTQIADILQEEAASAWSQPSADGSLSLSFSAAPKRATADWSQSIEEEEKERWLFADVTMSAENQPLASTASPQTQPLASTAFPQTQPLASTAFPQTQPPQTPQGDAHGDDDDDEKDNEDFDNWAAVGEQSIEEEAVQADRQHPGIEDSEVSEVEEDIAGDEDWKPDEHAPGDNDSEVEEREFMLKVAGVRREWAKQERYGTLPRFHSAVGERYTKNQQVHDHALKMCEAAELTLESLCASVFLENRNRNFVDANNWRALSFKFDLLHREPQSMKPSSEGSGWRLVDILPDMGQLCGVAMSKEIFAKTWNGNYEEVTKHLLKTRRGIA